jgi:hypothetical protein
MSWLLSTVKLATPDQALGDKNWGPVATTGPLACCQSRGSRSEGDVNIEFFGDCVQSLLDSGDRG